MAKASGALARNQRQSEMAAAAAAATAPQEEAVAVTFQNRIVGHDNMAVTALSANPDNWREHPKEQLEPLLGMLKEVGWVGEIMYNRTTGRMIDGHARVLLAERERQSFVPVTVVELSEDEEFRVLATYDFISGLAVRNVSKLRALLAKLPASQVPEVEAMIADLRDVTAESTPVTSAQSDAFQRDNPFEGKAAATDAAHGADQSIMRNINVLIEKDAYDQVQAELNWLAKLFKLDNYSDTVVAAIHSAYSTLSADPTLSAQVPPTERVDVATGEIQAQPTPPPQSAPEPVASGVGPANPNIPTFQL